MIRSFVLGALVFGAVSSYGNASTIAITYSLTGVGTVQGSTATTLMLVAQASGSVSSANAGLSAAWNPVSYSDQSVLDLTTNLLNGIFILSFANGDLLHGTVFEDDSAIDSNPTQTGPFPQTLTFTGGTGEFAGANGFVSGNGFLGPTSFTVSGKGTLNTSAVPEPASEAFLVVGLAIVALAGLRTKNRLKQGSTLADIDENELRKDLTICSL